MCIFLLYDVSFDFGMEVVECGGMLVDKFFIGKFLVLLLSEVLSSLVGVKVLIVLDEFDWVVDLCFCKLVVELIKNLFDWVLLV